MKRLACLLAMALLAFPSAARAQGVGLSVNLNVSIHKIGSWIEATAVASASTGGWVYVAAELDGGGSAASGEADWLHSASVHLQVWAEDDTWYLISAGACAQWWDGWYDCDSAYEFYHTPIGTPVIDDLSPASGSRGQCYTLQIFGENLDLGSVGSDSPDLSIGTSTAYSNQIYTTLCVGEEAAYGAHPIHVATGAGRSNSLPFTVN